MAQRKRVSRNDALASHEPRLGVHLDGRAAHHALRRVDRADVDLPVTPAITNAVAVAQKLPGSASGQAGETPFEYIRKGLHVRGEEYVHPHPNHL